MTTREAFAATFDVPRETLVKFDRYAELLAEWQRRMNLVGPSTLPQVWHRHFADSAQLLPIAGLGKSWLDIGAGAGFPGLVVAQLDLQGQVTIENRRIETLPRQKVDIITARALASLEQLFDWGLPFAGSGTRWLLPKGLRFADEIDAASRRFSFAHHLIPSQTDDQARIVVASGVQRR
jgi:16S rRNA (guanine527-N7)-methyltransferase